MIYHSILVTPKQEARSIIQHPTAYNGRLTQDELNALINELTIPNKKEYRQQVYNLFASLERAVEENF